jgi:isopentenyldiphosphate isomerase
VNTPSAPRPTPDPLTTSVAEELLTLVSDDDAQVLGPVKRKAVHGNPDLVHRAVHVLVISSQGHLLLQKRSLSKDVQPGRWDTSVGGHVGFGQSYEEAARRETLEELGITLESPEFLYPSRIRSAVESENIWTYLHRYDGPFQHDPGEIDAIQFWSKTEIEAALGTGVFTSNFEEEFAALLASPHGVLLR